MGNVFYKRYKDDNAAKEELQRLGKYANYHDCFSGYENFYDGNDYAGFIYFGFEADKKIYDLADEVNKNFKNIQVIMVDFLPDGKCLFRIKLDDRYSAESKYILTFTMAQFMRGFGIYYDHYKCANKNVVDDFINNNLKAQNTSKYGGWLCCDPSGKFSCEREIFDKFDNIELINELVCGRMNFEEMPSIHRFIRVLDGSQQLSYLKRVGSIWE